MRSYGGCYFYKERMLKLKSKIPNPVLHHFRKTGFWSSLTIYVSEKKRNSKSVTIANLGKPEFQNQA